MYDSTFRDQLDLFTAKSQIYQKYLEGQVGGSHYRDMEIQPIEYILKNKIGFSEGNVIKYVSRWRSKGGIQDLEKAVQTLQQLISHEKSKNETLR